MGEIEREREKCWRRNRVGRTSTFPRKYCNYCHLIHLSNSMWPARSPPLPSRHVSPLLNLNRLIYAPYSRRRMISLPNFNPRLSPLTLLSPKPLINSPPSNKKKSDPISNYPTRIEFRLIFFFKYKKNLFLVL